MLLYAIALHYKVVLTVYIKVAICDHDDKLFKINICYPDTNKWDDAIDTPYAEFAMTVLVYKLIIVGGVRESA